MSDLPADLNEILARLLEPEPGPVPSAQLCPSPRGWYKSWPQDWDADKWTWVWFPVDFLDGHTMLRLIEEMERRGWAWEITFNQPILSTGSSYVNVTFDKLEEETWHNAEASTIPAAVRAAAIKALEASTLQACGHPLTAIVTDIDDLGGDVGTCYCGECAKESRNERKGELECLS